MDECDLPSISSFKAETKKLERLKVTWAAAAIVALFASFGLAILIRELRIPNAETYARVLLAMVVVPMLLLAFVRIDRLFRRFPKLICRYCKSNLAAAPSVVIATANCPSCGRRALNDTSIGT